MTEGAVLQIEGALGLSLPPDYRAFLVDHGDELALAKRKLEDRALVWTNPETIVKENLLTREVAEHMTLGDSEQSEIPWPAAYLVVGTNGGGDYYFVDRTGELPGIWFWQHEDHGIKQIAPTWEAYLIGVRSDPRLSMESIP